MPVFWSFIRDERTEDSGANGFVGRIGDAEREAHDVDFTRRSTLAHFDGEVDVAGKRP
jgi:hypothetical protein